MNERLIEYSHFSKLFSDNGMKISEEVYGRLDRYADMLCVTNEKMNLTAITDPEGISVKHMYDSIYPFELFKPAEGASLIDVGTGAGFPSVPLKIYRPDIRLTLLDSLNKRVRFLQEISDELGLGAECIHGRAEETGRFIKSGNPLRESFDIATARAVANLRELCEYCLPFVKVGGYFAALKGRDARDELENAERAIGILGGELSEVFEYSLPNGDERALIIVRKIKPTPNKYPRNSGQMKKKEL